MQDNTIPNAIESFALALKEKGCEITVIRPNFLLNAFIRNHKVPKGKLYFSKNIKIHNRNFILPFWNSDISFLEEKFDVIISHMPSGHIYASLINKKLKLPHIAIVHQSDWEVMNGFVYKFYFKGRLKKALKNATTIGARNNFLKEKFNADFLLPSFVEEDKIVENKVFNDKKLKIITFSRLIKRKNIDKVIKALAKVDFDFEFSIYGEGNERYNLEKLMYKYKLKSKMEVFNYIQHRHVFPLLDENDVFILPSVKETFGISYIEAMARGLVTVGCKNTGIDGIIHDKENGFLVEPKVEDISKVLKEINTMNKEEISKNAISTMKNLTKEKVIQDYLDIIKKVVKKDF
jgi:hypothetical protein